MWAIVLQTKEETFTSYFIFWFIMEFSYLYQFTEFSWNISHICWNGLLHVNSFISAILHCFHWEIFIVPCSAVSRIELQSWRQANDNSTFLLLYVMRRHIIYCIFLWVMPATKLTKFGSRYLKEGSSEQEKILQVATEVVDVPNHPDQWPLAQGVPLGS